MRKSMKKFLLMFAAVMFLFGSAAATVSAAGKTAYRLKVIPSNAVVKSSKMKLYTGTDTKLTVKLGTKKAGASGYTYTKLAPDRVTYRSGNPSVASVSKKGVITPKKQGKTVLTVSYKKQKAKITVTVAKPSPRLSATSLRLKAGKTASLSVTGTSGKATWSSSKSSVAAVDSKGRVKAKKKGSAVITAKVNGKKLTCAVTVTQSGTAAKKVTSVKLDHSSLSLSAIGETATLKASVAPSKAANKKLRWSSSNTKAVKVNGSGKVTAVGKGTATVTAAALDGSGKKASCKVTVAFSPTDVKGLLQEYTDGNKDANPTVTIRFTNNSCDTIYIDHYIRIYQPDRMYTDKYSGGPGMERASSVVLSTIGHEDIPLKSKETKVLHFALYSYTEPDQLLKTRYFYYCFTPDSFITCTALDESGKEYSYVIDPFVSSGTADLTYTGYSDDADYAATRSLGGTSVGGDSGTDIGGTSGKARICPFCKSRPGVCTTCGGSGRLSAVEHLITGNLCHTCRGTGKCACCGGDGLY